MVVKAKGWGRGVGREAGSPHGAGSDFRTPGWRGSMWRAGDGEPGVEGGVWG